jgi:hypothetical protein
VIGELLGGSATPRRQRPLLVREGRIIPARLGVSQEIEALGDARDSTRPRPGRRRFADFCQIRAQITRRTGALLAVVILR